MICIDEKVRFDPFQHDTGTGADTVKGTYVVGTVVMVNYEHKVFFVEYDIGENKYLRTSFKFSQLGNEVVRCG